jgi:hypothetical protein
MLEAKMTKWELVVYVFWGYDQVYRSRKLHSFSSKTEYRVLASESRDKK